MGCYASKVATPLPAPGTSHASSGQSTLLPAGARAGTGAVLAKAQAVGAGNPSTTVKVKVHCVTGLAASVSVQAVRRPVCAVQLVGKPGSKQSTGGSDDPENPAWHMVLEVTGYASGDELSFTVFSSDAAQPEQLGSATLSAGQVFAGFVGELDLLGGGKLQVTVDGTDPTLAQELAHITEEVTGLAGAFNEATRIVTEAFGKVAPVSASVAEDGKDLVKDAGKLAELAQDEVAEIIETEAVLCKC